MDKTYWIDYYKNNEPPKEPSLFAQVVLSYILKRRGNSPVTPSLLELGCGNGRDRIYFAQNGIDVTAIDQVDEICRLRNRFKSCKNLNFIREDFTDFPGYLSEKYDFIYSRFTLHSIREDEANTLLKNVHDNLKTGGKLFIEARSVNDDIFGKGMPVKGERNAFIYNDHYRRFIDGDELVETLSRIGFNIIYTEESKNFAPYRNERPSVIRVEATIL